MGYDMYLIKIKKNVLNELKKETNLSLSDLYCYGILDSDNINSKYSNEVINEITSSNDIFKRYFKENNINCDCDECIEISFNQLLKMKLWLENYLKTTLFEELDEVDSCSIASLFELFKFLNNFILNLSEDDAILFEHDW